LLSYKGLEKMENKTSIEVAADTIKKLWAKHGIKQPLQFLGFCLSLLPYPVIQQVGQVLDRHLSDTNFNRELDDLWNEVKKANKSIEKIDSLDLVIKQIATTLNDNIDLSNRTQKFISQLAQIQHEFSVVTEKNSYQELLNTIVNAKVSSFTAKLNSTNVLNNTTINSEHTVLLATGGSTNRISNSTFNGATGSVSMKHTESTGSASINNSSVRLNPGSNFRITAGGEIKVGNHTNKK